MNKTISIVFHHEGFALANLAPSPISAQSIVLEAAAGAVRTGSKHGYAIGATVVDIDGATQVDFHKDAVTISVIKPRSRNADTALTTEPIFDFEPNHKF